MSNTKDHKMATTMHIHKVLYPAKKKTTQQPTKVFTLWNFLSIYIWYDILHTVYHNAYVSYYKEGKRKEIVKNDRRMQVEDVMSKLFLGQVSLNLVALLSTVDSNVVGGGVWGGLCTLQVDLVRLLGLSPGDRGHLILITAQWGIQQTHFSQGYNVSKLNWYVCIFIDINLTSEPYPIFIVWIILILDKKWLNFIVRVLLRTLYMLENHLSRRHTT